MDKDKFNKHKASAKFRGIDFQFTFEEWCEMWKPYWDNRGTKDNQYVMSRKGDTGPYSKENCVIKTWSENRKEQKPPNTLIKKIGQKGIDYIKNNSHLGPTVLSKKFNIDRNAVARILGTQKNRAK